MTHAMNALRQRNALKLENFTKLNNKFVKIKQPKTHSLLNTQSFFNTFQTAFLPRGFPNTVTREYIPYSTYQFLSSISGTITGTLSMHAMLQAISVPFATSLGISATTNWIIKDGIGLLGGVIFAANTSTKFDSDAKKYRFFSTVLIQTSTFIEILTPIFPKFFVLLASISNIGKNIGWIATSATKASMNRGLTLEDNLGDVTAKSGYSISNKVLNLQLLVC